MGVNRMTDQPRTPPAHILVVEDDRAVARGLRDGLEREGFQVTWRASGSEGVAFVRAQRPQLLVLDLRLPDGSGLDFCRQLRGQGERLPILVLTAQRDEIDKVLGLEMGADDYLTKPFGLRELIARIRALLRRAYGELASASADRLYAGDLVIDRARAEVLRGAQRISLTPIEFRLLVTLARHAGQALTRAQILEAVWGHDASLEDERTVNVHIRRLREKVEIDASRPALIVTVPGVGYRLARSDG